MHPRRLRHAALHAARARPEHRRRLRRAARPRLRRVLRLRRVRLRDARLATSSACTGRRRRSSRSSSIADDDPRPARRAAVAAARRRLPRDRDALLRAALRHRRRTTATGSRSSASPTATTSPAGRTGSRTSTRSTSSGTSLESLTSYYYVALGCSSSWCFAAVYLVEQLAHRPRLAVAARGLARGRDDGHARQPAEALRVRVRRRRSPGSTGTLFASLNTAVFAADFDTPTADHDLRDADPRRRRQPRRRHPRRARRQRLARGAAHAEPRDVDLLHPDRSRR